MKVLWAPWRLEYILAPKPDACVFCVPQHTNEDEERLILHRGKHAFVLLNKFPYNNGHLLIAPYRHVSDIAALKKNESHEIMDLLQVSSQMLQKGLSPEGVNMGLNLGKAAGAGICGHLHFHAVPRWSGDSSFMAVLDEISLVPEHLKDTYKRLLVLFKSL